MVQIARVRVTVLGVRPVTDLPRKAVVRSAKLATVRASESLPRAVASAQEAGRKYINVASHLLAGAQRKRNA